MEWSSVFRLPRFENRVPNNRLHLFKPDSENLDFLKIWHKSEIIFQKFDKTKNNLIYAEMVKILRYYSYSLYKHVNKEILGVNNSFSLNPFYLR